MSRGPTIGVLHPDHLAVTDYLRLEAQLSVQLPRARVAHSPIDPEAAFTPGLRQLARRNTDVVTWACTSESFERGPEGALTQVRWLARAIGGPASSTSLAFIAAVRALGVGKVAVAASYPASVTALFVDFLAAAEISVVATASAEITTAAEVGTLQPAQVAQLVAQADSPRAEAVLVPNTALHTIEVLTDLEKNLGKPVLTANQVTVWEGLRLTATLPTTRTLGRLFTISPSEHT